MTRLNTFLPVTLFSVTLVSQLWLNLGLPPKLQAQPSSAHPMSDPSLSEPTQVSVTFDPQGEGKPDNSAGGASRSPDGKICPQDASASQTSITALVPTKNEALTVAKHPTFLVYLPPTSARSVFFSLQDENKNNLYQKILPISGESGIISIKLPTDAAPLEKGKNYKWYFQVMCGNSLRPDSPGIESQIRRVEPDPDWSNNLDKVVSIEQAATYGKNGIWYDTVATLADLRRSQPENTTYLTNWQQILKSVGLEAIAKEPLLPE